MGNCVSISVPCDSWMNKVSQGLDKQGGYVHNLEKNLVALESTIEELKAKRNDLLRKATREEDRGQERLEEFQVWLSKVESLENRVYGLLSARDVQLQRLCLCGLCSKSLRSTCLYGKDVFLTLKEVEKLHSREFEVIVDQAQTPQMEARPLQPTIVGQETMLDKAWKHLKEEGVGIMGMYGMGGVGKTTLLTQINNKFSEERCGFDFVIWVVVSKELHVEKIQDEIAQKVGLGGDEWKQKEKSQKGTRLYNLLRKKRFVLFFDDIWEKVDLTEIGVPVPTTQNRCKVAFTTRSQDVCARMGVEDPMEVKCLDDNDAFDLFKEKVGKRTIGSNLEIPELAGKVAKKCCGLPLALSVIGETMSSKRTVQEWLSAIDVLTSYAMEFADMKDKILPLLKFSYDNLKGEDVKSCLLYCALYPEDYEIFKEKLIGSLICEGIIDGSKGIERAENKGYEIIGDLVRASLLMDVVNVLGTHVVRMHDVVREMALWIASELRIENEAFIVHAGVGLSEIPKVKNWNSVRRMSLMKNKIRNLAGSPECLQLTTFLMQNGCLVNISSEFFKSMPKLAVLDLSGNSMLRELPEGVSDLVSLKYLNLSCTPIRHLPKGLQELKKLIHLNLEHTRQLSSIVGISNLHNLMILNLAQSGFSWDRGIVEELNTLEHLDILTISFNDRTPYLELFLSSHRLTSCTRVMHSCYLESTGIAIPVTMDKLRDFGIFNWPISEIKMGRICNISKTVSPLHNLREPCFLSLSRVDIGFCKYLRELTLLMFASNLTELYVRNADQLEDIINKEKASEGGESGIVPFPKLVYLRLWSLPELKNIYWNPLRFPCLKRFLVIECPKLKKLPLDSQSGENGLILTCQEKGWIEGVEWEDEATKTRFLSSRELFEYWNLQDIRSIF